MGLMESDYRYGGSHPDAGFDCSGLVAYVFKQAASQRLPHNTQQIAQLSRPIRKSQLKAGDFVFFNTLNRPFSHMGIYIGNAQFVTAPSSGGPLRLQSLDNPYFATPLQYPPPPFRPRAPFTPFRLFLRPAPPLAPPL